MARCKFQTENGKCKNKSSIACKGMCRKHFDIIQKQQDKKLTAQVNDNAIVQPEPLQHGNPLIETISVSNQDLPSENEQTMNLKDLDTDIKNENIDNTHLPEFDNSSTIEDNNKTDSIYQTENCSPLQQQNNNNLQDEESKHVEIDNEVQLYQRLNDQVEYSDDTIKNEQIECDRDDSIEGDPIENDQVEYSDDPIKNEQIECDRDDSNEGDQNENDQVEWDQDECENQIDINEVDPIENDQVEWDQDEYENQNDSNEGDQNQDDKNENNQVEWDQDEYENQNDSNEGDQNQDENNRFHHEYQVCEDSNPADEPTQDGLDTYLNQASTEPAQNTEDNTKDCDHDVSTSSDATNTFVPRTKRSTAPVKLTRPVVKRTILECDQAIEPKSLIRTKQKVSTKKVTFSNDVKPPTEEPVIRMTDAIEPKPIQPSTVTEPMVVGVITEEQSKTEENLEVPMITGSVDWVLANGERKKVLTLVSLLKSARSANKASVFVPDYMDALKLASSRDGYLLLNAMMFKVLPQWLLNFKDRTFNLTDTLSIKVNTKSAELLKQKLENTHQVLKSFAQSMQEHVALTPEPKYVFYVAHHSMHWRPEQSSSGNELNAYLWCTTSIKDAVNKANSCDRHWNPVLVMIRLMSSKHCLPFAKKGINKASLLLLPQNKIKWVSSKPTQTQQGQPARRIFEGDSFMIAPHVTLYKMSLSE